MKLEKLLTLSQFVDLVTENTGDIEDYYTNKDVLIEAEKCDTFPACAISTLITSYNNFLKQPLTKEMFVNPYNRPMNLMSKTYSHDREMFEEAEKKVMFEPHEDTNINIIVITAETLGRYANAMNGDVKLKNVTI